jgi:large subunit ribosomal protein L46
MAGQAKPNVKSVHDFAWLTKQEIQARVAPQYWNGIKDILSEY